MQNAQIWQKHTNTLYAMTETQRHNTPRKHEEHTQETTFFNFFLYVRRHKKPGYAVSVHEMEF